MKKALIFGGTGQAGYYLGKLLVAKGYEVWGTQRPHIVLLEGGKGLPTGVRALTCDLTMPSEIAHVVVSVRPDEIYNMAACMFAPDSWANAYEYITVNASAVGAILLNMVRFCPHARFFQAGSGGVFLPSATVKQEMSLVGPVDPYHLSKLMAWELVKMYREEKGLFACTGVFFNMESGRRAPTFFTRKVTRTAVISRMREDAGKPLARSSFGSLHAIRDWGLTEEYVDAAWRMLKSTSPEDYIISTGESHSCYDFLKEAFTQVGLEDVSKYVDIAEVAEDQKTRFDVMLASPSKAKECLGWEAKTKFKGVVQYLIKAAEKELVPVNAA